MRLLELASEDAATAIYDPANDRLNRRSLSDTRKPLLTLRQVNKLKKVRALRKLENLKRQDLLGIMYSQPEDDAGGGMMGGL
jgi:hypothetical protein